MKQCSNCGQIVAQQMITCPVCGSGLCPGISGVDDYALEKVLHEGLSSFVFKARKPGHKMPVTIRLFTHESGVDDDIAHRLDEELKTLAKLPPDLFVQHYAIRKSGSGLWYRVSEWVNADNWGRIFLSGKLNDQRRLATLFYNIASSLDTLHSHGHIMPFLMLDDILLPKTSTRNLAIKLNFKLSRFLNPKATHHGPALRKLMAIHPDMVSHRAIDARSGIWSLGKVFVELLTADPNLTRFSSKLDDIRGLDPELAVLIRVMLSDDPDLRPQSMARVAESLENILERLPSKPLFSSGTTSQAPPKAGRARIAAAAAAVLVIAAVLSGFYALLRPPPEPEGTTLSQLLESHSRSIGFLVVEYWLKAKDQIIYQNRVEGTAFAADRAGYILTNRHVACPWLEDASLFLARYREKDRPVELGHRMFLWFEGERAFNRLPGLEGSRDLADAYILSNAFQSGGRGNLHIAGVPRSPAKIGRGLYAQFIHDFAVLKIDALPKDIYPLPFETGQAPEAITRLSPVIIMGFPLGSRTQDDRISASITQGHVRRTSRELIQVDSSIYKGNSGGPAVNSQGKVIGIASGVITEKPIHQLPLFTPLSDFGLVLPIEGPRQFISSLKAGHPKWNGSIDFSVENKIEKILDLAVEEKFDEAAALAGRFLESSQDPALIFTAGLLDFCRNDRTSGRQRFVRLLSMEGENTAARLMLYIMDWLDRRPKLSDRTRPLFDMDWQDSDAFSGYLARVLAEGRAMEPACLDYENPAEESWRKFIDGLILEQKKLPGRAADVYREVAMTAGANDQIFLMALARLSSARKALPGDKATLAEDHRSFHRQAIAARKEAKTKYAEAAALINTFESPESGVEQKTAAADRLLALSPFNRTIYAKMAFFHAGRSDWDKAQEFIQAYFSRAGRETRLSLGLGLLKGQVLGLAGDGTAQEKQLSEFRGAIQNPWYRAVAAQLLENGPLDNMEEELLAYAADSPARHLTLHTALGLASELKEDAPRAARHYREALGTYLDAWFEYGLARDRLLALRRPKRP